MKNFFLKIAAIAYSSIAFSQNTTDEVDLKELQIANSPALSLLDNTAAVITSNSDVKDFNVNTENLSKITFEYTLFLKKRKNMKGLEYYGLGSKESEIKSFTSHYFRPTLSGALNQSQSMTSFSVGFSMNLITVYSKKDSTMQSYYHGMKNDAANISELADEELSKMDPPIKRGDEGYAEAKTNKMSEIGEAIKEDNVNSFSMVLKKPMFLWDVASAYSVLFPSNEYKVTQPDRLGVWSTLTFSLNFSKDEKKNKFINAYLFSRYLQDKSVLNELTEEYNNSFKFFDFGGKVQFDFNKFSFGYEYIKRNGDGKDFRSVGVLQYQLRKDIYLTGGFGKNFEAESQKDLVTLFGIRFGINEKDLIDWE